MGEQPISHGLARREQQIMDVIHTLGEASVAQVREKLADPPSYSSVRTMIRHLETKGMLKHRQEGKCYIYRPAQSRHRAGRSAMSKLLDVFFGGSPSAAMAAILDLQGKEVDKDELNRIEQLIQKARRDK